MAIRKKVLTTPPEPLRFVYEDEIGKPAKPKWTYKQEYAHWGPSRLDEAFEEAVRAPGSRTMRRRAAGAELSIRDLVLDILEVLERVDE